MLDFNNAEVQSEGSVSAIPEDSIIPFKMTIRPPKSGKEGSTHNLFCKSGKGNEYIDVEFEAQGKFSGRKIWQNFTLVGSDQAAKISMRTLRAIVESARGISPSDASPAASAGRQLSDWADFNNLVFLVKVKCVVEQSQKDGNWYVNNEIKKIITPDDAEYSAGEFVSDKPLPTVPAPGEKATGSVTASVVAAASAGNWGAQPAAATAAVATQAAQQQTSAPIPVWATR